MEKVVKVLLREEDIITLDNKARERGIPRVYLLREVIEQYLAGTPAGTQKVPEAVPLEVPGDTKVLTKALEEVQGEREVLLVRVAELEKLLNDKTRDLVWIQGQYQALTHTLDEAVKRIPPPPALLEDGRPRPPWWRRMFGGGEGE